MPQQKEPDTVDVMYRSAGKPPLQFLTYPELQTPVNAEWSGRLRRTLAAQVDEVRSALSEPDFDSFDKTKLRDWLNRAEKKLSELDGGQRELDHDAAIQATNNAARARLLTNGGNDGWLNVGTGQNDFRSADDRSISIRLMPSDGTVNELVSQYAAHRSGGVSHDGEPQYRALITAADVTPRPIAGAAPNRYAEPRSIPGVLGMRPETALAGGMAFLRVGATPAEGPVAEGTNKPEWDALSGDSLAPVTLARWSQFTRQSFESHADFRRALFHGHARGISRDLDALVIAALVSGAGAALPLDLSNGGTSSIRGAIARIEDAIAVSPDLVIVSVDDYESLTFDSTNASDVNSRVTSVAGVPVYATTSISAGDVLVANVRSGAYVATGPVESVVRDLNLRQNTMEARTEVSLNYKPTLLGSVVLLSVGS